VASQRIVAWVRARCNDKDHPVVSFSVEHLTTGGNSGKEVGVPLPLVEGCPTMSTEEIASTLENMAEVFAEGLQGSQQFRLVAVLKTGGTLEFPFRKHGEADASGYGTESASPTGHLAQMMRLNEALTRIGLVHSESLLGKAVDMLGIVTKQNESLMHENAEAFSIVREVLMKQTLANDERALKLIKEKRNADLWRKGVGIAPAVINRLLGSEVIPQSTADSALIDSIAENITAEQVEMLAHSGMLPAPVMGLLMDRLKERFDAKEKEDALAKVEDNG